uniref:Putative ovule protein n=1 Tax=Solanum chacoense TaxID=4108 RepID=A0A0V0I2W7_SOLCH
MKMRSTDAKLLFIDNCDVWSSTPIDRNPVFYNRKKGSSLLLPMQIAMYFLTPLPIIYVFLRKEDNMVQFNQTTTHQESTRATVILLIVKLKL